MKVLMHKKLNLKMSVFGEKTSIQKFYSNSVIFITGGTGYVGAGIIEKLLRTCPDIQKIYALVRAKKGKSTEDRRKECFNDMSFAKLKKFNPNFKNSIYFMNGDISQENLGLNENDRNVIINEVTIIFHLAATVRFDEKMRTAILSNVRATRDLLFISKKCKNLKAFVHMSTAYSNCYLRNVKEEFYDTYTDPEELIKYCENHDEDEVEKNKSFYSYPNSYTFSKGLGEAIIKKYSKGVPITIVRPSIIYGCVEGSLPGWINNLYGPVGIMTGVGLGVIRVFPLVDKNITDVIPMDYAVNCAIACAWNAEKCFQQGDLQPKIYHICTSKRNPINWEDIYVWSISFASTMMSKKAVWVSFFIKTTNKMFVPILEFLLHYLPAYVIDFSLKICGKKKSGLISIYKKLNKLGNLLQFFVINEWIFDDTNTENLYKQLDFGDKLFFNFDVASIEWDVFFFHLVRIIRIHIIKDPISSMKESRKHIQKLKVANFLLVSFLIILMISFFKFIYQIIFSF